MATNDILADVGQYNNLDDPVPVLNKEEVILGVIISSLVCNGPLNVLDSKRGVDELFRFYHVSALVGGYGFE